MEKFIVEDIPAVLLGEPSDKIYIYVHGKLCAWQAGI